MMTSPVSQRPPIDKIIARSVSPSPDYPCLWSPDKNVHQHVRMSLMSLTTLARQPLAFAFQKLPHAFQGHPPHQL